MRLGRFWNSLDKTVLFTTLLLMFSGWMMVLSATLPPGQEKTFPLPLFALKQGVWMSLGLMVMFAAMAVDYHVLLRLAPWIYGFSIFLLALVLGIGHTSFGARRWFSLGMFFVQPGELMKLAVLLMVVRRISASPSRERWPRWAVSTFIITVVPMVLILFQPNMGTAMLLFVSLLAVWVAAGVPGWLFGLAASSVAGLAPFVWAFMKDYQKARILNFVNPYRDPLGGGYSVIQSTIAIGSGGMLGKGWANGLQNRLEFIPKHHTDFIASVVGEEFGWVGCTVLLLLYVFLFLGALRIAHRARDAAGAHLVTGITLMLAFQTSVNLGMNMGVVPVTGLPLPLFSYGGSSLIMSSVFLGIVLNVGRQRRR